MVQKAHNQEMSSIYSQRHLQKNDCVTGRIALLTDYNRIWHT